MEHYAGEARPTEEAFTRRARRRGPLSCLPHLCASPLRSPALRGLLVIFAVGARPLGGSLFSVLSL